MLVKKLSYSLMGLCLCFLAACAKNPSNPEDPLEPLNRKIHGFNMALDGFILKPVARVYRSVLPPPWRMGVTHFYDNINTLPTIANDLLQGEWQAASDDAGRLLINTSIGIGGLFDVAKDYNLPLHKNDLGLTLAKWGYKKSAFIMIPLIGPSTIRDGIGLAGDSFLTPYFYLSRGALINSLIALRYVDLRAQFLETEKLLEEALDQYAFLRDAYLQNRHYLITGDMMEEDDDEESDSDGLYVDDEGEETEGSSDYVDE